MSEFIKPISSFFLSEDMRHPYAESDDAFKPVEGESKMPEVPKPKDQREKTLLLGNAKRDLEAFRLYARHLHQHNEFDDLAIMEDTSRIYMKEHVDALLRMEKSTPNYETLRLSVVVLFTKAMLLYEFNDPAEVEKIIDDLKMQYSQYYDIAVNHFGYEVIRETIKKFENMPKGKVKDKGKSKADIPGSSDDKVEDERIQRMIDGIEELKRWQEENWPRRVGT